MEWQENGFRFESCCLQTTRLGVNFKYFKKKTVLYALQNNFKFTKRAFMGVFQKENRKIYTTLEELQS